MKNAIFFVSRETFAKKQTDSPLPNCLPALMWGVKEKDMGYDKELSLCYPVLLIFTV